jgi:serine/threonine protein kinase/Tol biopolymer transport system component/tetratricopeptide (TPR) repeat protein
MERGEGVAVSRAECEGSRVVTSERWKEVKEIFAAALERTPKERDAFLNDVCAGDEPLRHEVESLIASHQDAGDFIESPAMNTNTFLSEVEEPDVAAIGRRIGAYKIVSEIGRGGMGSVYLAVRADDEFERRVAIKLIRSGMEIDFVIRRFRSERQILANLDHPYIARLLDGGTTEDNLPYFVMEYVEGLPIHRYCDERRLSMTERLALFLKVCEAVEYAHQRQVIHRDLKPGNILVTAEGTPKLLDFGIAKPLDAVTAPTMADPTTVGFRMMTPAYASPEQLRGQPATARSDIYSMAVLLFELITGRRPERGPSSSADSRTEITRNVPPGLDSIIVKALRDDPRERYASVADCAEDIRRHLEGLPTSQAPYATTGHAADPDTKETTGPRTIAVMPFRSIGAEDKSDEYLGVGMADALITRLSNIRRIIVRPTSSVLKYARGEYDPITAARDLDVRYVLDGRMQRVADRVRVTVQLVRGRDGSPLWAAKFDEKFTDILNLEDSLSEQVAYALIERLTQEERELLHKRGTENAEAYQAYLKGRYYWGAYTEESLSKALVCFMEALALDPQFAHAQAGVADYYNWLGVWNVMPPDECFAAAKDAAQKALELDPLLAEAHSSLAFSVWAYDRDWATARREVERAIELNPDLAPAHQWYSYLASGQGRHADAIPEIERARHLNPLSPIMAAVAAFIYYNAGRYDHSLEILQQASRIDPNQVVVQQGFAWGYGQKGMFREAIAAARKAAEMAPRNPLPLWTLAWALAASGDHAEAREVLAKVMDIASTRYVSPYYIALIHTALDEFDTALDWLDKGYEKRDWWLMWMGVEPRFGPLRDHERFRALLGCVGIEPGVQCCGPSDTEPATHTIAASAIQPAPAPVRTRASRLPYYAAVAILLVIAALFAIAKLVTVRTRPAFDNMRVVKLTTNGTATSAGISPDGKYVAYALDEGGRQGIWIRQVANSASVQVVPPAEVQYRGLAFSRDVGSLYFVAYQRNDLTHGTLYQAPVLGGPAKKLSESVQSPITFSPDGQRLAFIRSDKTNARDELVVARLDGGGQWTLAARRHPDHFAYAASPAWSPDGSVIVTAVENSDSQGYNVKLITVQVKNGSQKLYSTKRWQFVEAITWLADGSGLLLIGQDPESSFQQVWEAPARGNARKLTSDLSDYIGLTVTADSQTLATVQFQILAGIWVAPDGDANRATQITPGIGRYYDLAWTPGGKILYSVDASDTVDLWERNADGQDARQLTSSSRRNYGASVTPDGKYILFHSNRGGNWNIWRMDADGSNAKPLTTDKNESGWAQTARDPNWVVFHHATAGGTLRLWKTPIEGGNAVEMTKDTCMRPVVSPRDGSIACWYTEDLVRPHWRIAVFGPEGGARPVKAFEFASSVSVESRLQWTPDGRAVTYVDNRGGTSNLWNQPIDGSPPRPLTTFKSAQIFSFAWSRDGRLAYSRGMQASDVVVFSSTQ